MCPHCVVVAVLLEVLDVPDRAVYTFASNSFLSVPSPCASYTFITWVLSHQKWAFSMAPPYCASEISSPSSLFNNFVLSFLP